MGLQLELNTLFRLGQSDPNPGVLMPGFVFTTTKTNLRLYPVGLPIILLTEDWHAIGYCVVKHAAMSPDGMKLEVEVTTRFSEKDSQIHTDRVIEALTITGYLPKQA